jgi:hypothetical protein
MCLVTVLAVVCWSWICRLGSIVVGSLDPINTLPLDHNSDSPESQSGLLPDINKPPLEHFAVSLDRSPHHVRMRAGASGSHSRKEGPVAWSMSYVIHLTQRNRDASSIEQPLNAQVVLDFRQRTSRRRNGSR